MKTAYELLQQNRDLLYRLQMASICIDDIRHLEMFEEFLKMQKEGEKARYIASSLSKKYAVGEATVWRIVKKLKAIV